VEARTRELLRGFARQVESRGVQLETFLAMTGQQPEELVARLSDEAQRSVGREIVLDAVADRLVLEIPDSQVEELVREQAEALGDDSDEMLTALRESGRFESLRDDLRLREALDRVAAEVKRIPLAQAEAREAIWTPDKENTPTETKLWTPDQPQSEGARS
jgi:trigger factor